MTKVLHFWNRGGRIAALMVLAIAGVTCLSASTITGGFGTTGTGVLVFSSGGVNYLDFCPTDPTASPATSPSCAGAAGYGKGDVTVSGGTGSFSGASGAATILDLKDSTSGSAAFTTLKVGVVSAVNNFLVLSALPGWNFQAQYFVPETCATCIGGFVLTQVGQNVSVSATINGIVYDTTGGSAAFTDILTGQYTNTTVAQVAALAQTTGGIFSNTWSNSVTTSPIPEPATLAILGGGLLFLGSLKRRIRG